jgi:hypothetical protein
MDRLEHPFGIWGGVVYHAAARLHVGVDIIRADFRRQVAD